MGLKDIKLLVMDVDGVLTDGTVVIGPEGDETKFFNVKDGTGIKYLQRTGIRAAFLSGRSCPAVEHRARELNVTEVHLGARDKLPVLHELMKRLGLKPEEVAFVGDDLVDIPVAREVGFSAAVADAHEELKSRCDYVTSVPGGRGAVREVAEVILKAQDKWSAIMERYL